MALEYPDQLNRKEYSHVVAVFSSRDQFLAFNQWYQLRWYISYINDLKYSKIQQGQIAKSIGVGVLVKAAFIHSPSEISERNISQFITNNLEVLLKLGVYSEDEEFMKQNSHILFLERFQPYSLYPMILNKCIEALERSREYELAIVMLLFLLIHKCKKYKRAKWWYRLALDLNHIDRTIDSFYVWATSLRDDKTLNNGKRNYLVMYLKMLRVKLTKTLMDNQRKQYQAKQRVEAWRKKKKQHSLNTFYKANWDSGNPFQVRDILQLCLEAT